MLDRDNLLQSKIKVLKAARALRRLDGYQNNQQIFLKFLDMICKAINHHLVMKSTHIFEKFDYFALSQYRALHLKEVNKV